MTPNEKREIQAASLYLGFHIDYVHQTLTNFLDQKSWEKSAAVIRLAATPLAAIGAPQAKAEPASITHIQQDPLLLVLSFAGEAKALACRSCAKPSAKAPVDLC